MSPENIFVSGYAKLPKGITATELYSVIAVGLLINKKTGEILDAEASLVLDMAQTFFKKIVTGENINNIDCIEKTLKESYFGSARKAIISALRTCHEKYRLVIEGSNIED